jgi:hypothetical protein
MNVSLVPKDTTHQNVQFTDQIDPYSVEPESTRDPTRSIRDSDDASLQNFFSRPIKIHEAEWATSTNLSFQINPWSLYFDNVRVRAKIDNFNLLQCNLKVKVIINGNGFQYGRAMIAYLPYSGYDGLSTNTALVTQDLVGTSQLPHIFLDPCTSQGGEMTLPMYYHRDYINIPLKTWSLLGSLFCRTINDLKHANGATDLVTVSVFAWAEDVNLSVLTSVEPQMGDEVKGFEPQSGEIDEANAKGVISGPATAIAKMASMLTKVPYIGPFATATTMAATTSAAIAKMFGYSRPPVTKNPDPYRPTPFSSLALTNVPDTALKMTIDDKQELSIDPRIAGLGGQDPMNIREIAKRESYLTTFTWAVGTAPETVLWNSRVDPVIWAESAGPPVAYHLPACAFAALPFQYWTGTMKFRFQIVSSAYHRGRLKIAYDPNFFASNEYNTNFLRIVDINEEKDFTIEVNPSQDRALMEHHYPGPDSVTQMFSNVLYTAKEAGNGVLALWVVNELTIPNSLTNNDIEINVYVSMSDDFEVFVPDDHFQAFSFGATPQDGDEIKGFEPQSGMEISPDAECTTEPSAPLQSLSTTIGIGKGSSPHLNHVYTGESIDSFRTVLKRYSLWNTLPSLGDATIFGRMPHFPYLRGAVNDAVEVTDVATGSVPYNYCNTVMLHWVRNAFQGYRGSIRYKMIPRGVNSGSTHLSVQRAPISDVSVGSTNYLYSSASARPVYTTLKGARNGIMYQTSPSTNLPQFRRPFSGVLGQVVAHAYVNNTLEFELPWYSNARFEAGKRSSYTGWQSGTAPWDYRIDTIGDDSSHWDLHVAAGEDFQVYFFTGLPRLYYEPAPPL